MRKNPSPDPSPKAEVKTASAGPAGLLAAVRQSVADLDAAGAAIVAEMAKPAPLLGFHPLAQRLAKRHDPNEEVDMDTGYLRCSTCDAIAKCSCGCERPLYVKAGQRFLARQGIATAVTKKAAGYRDKRGRKPLGSRAMTAAERQRRRRAKHK